MTDPLTPESVRRYLSACRVTGGGIGATTIEEDLARTLLQAWEDLRSEQIRADACLLRAEAADAEIARIHAVERIGRSAISPDRGECDECTGCGHQGCDAAADWIDPAGVSWCAEHHDCGLFDPELAAALTAIPAEDPGDLGDLHHARIAADEAIGWLTGDRADLATAEAWLTRSLRYVRRERARLRGGAP